MGIKDSVRDIGSKVLEQSLKQWLGKAVLVVIPIIGMSAYHHFNQYKNNLILEPVRPELNKVNARIDSAVDLIDTLNMEQKRYSKQNTRFQTVLVKKLGLENEIKRIRTESKTMRAERADLENALEALGD